jgi:hypothetical protein
VPGLRLAFACLPEVELSSSTQHSSLARFSQQDSLAFNNLGDAGVMQAHLLGDFAESQTFFLGLCKCLLSSFVYGFPILLVPHLGGPNGAPGLEVLVPRHPVAAYPGDMTVVSRDRQGTETSSDEPFSDLF